MSLRDRFSVKPIKKNNVRRALDRIHDELATIYSDTNPKVSRDFFRSIIQANIHIREAMRDLEK